MYTHAIFTFAIIFGFATTSLGLPLAANSKRFSFQHEDIYGELPELTLLDPVITPSIDTELPDPALIAQVGGFERRSAPNTDIEILDPEAFNSPAASKNTQLTDIEKRSAPNTDFELPDPAAISNANPRPLVNIEKRGAPNTVFEISDPVVVTSVKDFEKRSTPNTDIEMGEPSCFACQKASPKI